MAKYNNKKTVIDGITFDSKREADYYCELLFLKKAGRIKDIELQPEFVLQDGFKKLGKKYRPIIYKADFKVTYPDGREEIIDVKGMETKEFKIKQKMFEARYDEYSLKIVK
jgi:hypothetical protein